MTKTLNQIIFFFLHQNQNIFFSNIGNQNIFLEKKHNPPPLSSQMVVPLELFDTMVLPVVMYGCEVWGFEKNNILESFCLQFLSASILKERGNNYYQIYENQMF
jgi:hypothetical protein